MNSNSLEKQLEAWGICFSLNIKSGTNIFLDMPEYTLIIKTPSGDKAFHFKEGEEQKAIQFASPFKQK